MTWEGRLDGAACKPGDNAIQREGCRRSAAPHHFVILKENPMRCGPMIGNQEALPLDGIVACALSSARIRSRRCLAYVSIQGGWNRTIRSQSIDSPRHLPPPHPISTQTIRLNPPSVASVALLVCPYLSVCLCLVSTSTQWHNTAAHRFSPLLFLSAACLDSSTADMFFSPHGSIRRIKIYRDAQVCMSQSGWMCSGACVYVCMNALLRCLLKWSEWRLYVDMVRARLVQVKELQHYQLPYLPTYLPIYTYHTIDIGCDAGPAERGCAGHVRQAGVGPSGGEQGAWWLLSLL